jgi:hypothetical protein
VNPRRVQYNVIALAVGVKLVSYLDQVSISVAAPAMRSEFGFTPLQMGQVFSAFSLSYAILGLDWQPDRGRDPHRAGRRLRRPNARVGLGGRG